MKRWREIRDLWLLTPEELQLVPNGTVLTSISNKTVIKGSDPVDLDTRAGLLAYGIIDPFNHEHQNLFLTFILSEA